MARNSKEREVSIPDLGWVEILGRDLSPPEGAVSTLKSIPYDKAKALLRRELKLGNLETGKFANPTNGGLATFFWPKK